MRTSRWIRLALAAALTAALGGWLGWQLAVRHTAQNIAKQVDRETGYQFVSPLLTCSQDSGGTFDFRMNQVLQAAVNQEESKGDINTAAVYYRNFGNGGWTTLNGNEKFYPASLGKVPLMIAYYSWEEESEEPVLSKDLLYPAGLPDGNAQQEIKPQNPIQPGRTYSVSDLIEAMIKDSDNNATTVLFANIPQTYIQAAFTDLNVPYLAPGLPPRDFMTVSDFAFFFRVLYNGTYISHADSEKALETLAATDFNDGLMAGVPAGTPVAHKFGLVSVAPNGTNVTSRELHDCGIVYPGQNPYLLCVMTKSSGSLTQAEQAIAAISAAAYKAAQAGK